MPAGIAPVMLFGIRHAELSAFRHLCTCTVSRDCTAALLAHVDAGEHQTSFINWTL